MDYSELKKRFGPKVIGQVLKILDTHTVLISNVLENVSIGDTLQIYEYVGSFTGEDGENYGTLEYVKANVIVESMEDRYCICKTPFTENQSSLAITPVLEQLYGKKKRSDLNVNQSDITPIVVQNEQVKVGDPVKKTS